MGDETLNEKPSTPEGQVVTCQSCGMPMSKESEFGTEAGGAKSAEYCRNCYSEGQFIEPDLDLGEMVQRVAAILEVHMGMPAPQAEMMSETLLVRLKRWR